MEEERRRRRNLPQSCRQKVVGGKMDIGMGKKKKGLNSCNLLNEFYSYFHNNFWYTCIFQQDFVANQILVAFKYEHIYCPEESYI